MSEAHNITTRLNNSWIDKYGIDSMSGNCGKVAGKLAGLLEAKGIECHWRSGRVAGQDGLHCWLELPDGTILDPTVQQYGAGLNPIVPTDNPRHGDYIAIP